MNVLCVFEMKIVYEMSETSTCLTLLQDWTDSEIQNILDLDPDRVQIVYVQIRDFKIEFFALFAYRHCSEN